jgi:hypothetical protein
VLTRIAAPGAITLVHRGCWCGERQEGVSEQGAVFGRAAALEADPAGTISGDGQVAVVSDPLMRSGLRVASRTDATASANSAAGVVPGWWRSEIDMRISNQVTPTLSRLIHSFSWTIPE